MLITCGGRTSRKAEAEDAGERGGAARCRGEGAAGYGFDLNRTGSYLLRPEGRRGQREMDL